MKYNQNYINTFGEQKLYEVLLDVQELSQIKESWINQFSEDKISLASKLLIKESLDHYVIKKINTDPGFINTEAFNNYVNFIKSICNEFIINNVHLEAITNPIFRDGISKRVIEPKLNLFYDITNYSININKYIYSILDKVKNGDAISQLEFDNICMVAAVFNNPKSKNNKILLKYILNDVKKYGLSINLKQMTFVTNVLPNLYLSTDSLDFSDKRIKIGDFLDEHGYTFDNAFFMSKYNSAVISKGIAKKCMSLEKSSVYTHREIEKINDIYSYIFVCFHELSHGRQYELSKSEKYNSTGMSYLIYIINDNEKKDYCFNHDSDEIEINADEYGWVNTLNVVRDFIPEDEELINVCFNNITASIARRAFSCKHNNDIKSLIRGLYDIQELKNNLKNSKINWHDKYPMLGLVFNRNGETNLRCLTINKFVDNFSYGINKRTNGDIGNEIGHYIVKYEYSKLIEMISRREFSEEEIYNVIKNLYEQIHCDEYHMRYLESVNVNQFKSTNHQYNLDSDYERIGNYYFIRNLEGLYKINMIYDAIKIYYPEIDKSYLNISKYDIDYILSLLDRAILKNEKDKMSVINILNYYDKSDVEAFHEISNYVKKVRPNIIALDNAVKIIYSKSVYNSNPNSAKKY